jgi:hypothetical protein
MQNLKILDWNIEGEEKKTEVLYDSIINSDANIIFLLETWHRFSIKTVV